MFKRISGKWKNYIEKLAAANEKSCGSQKLDCCGLNSDTQAKTSQNSSR